MNLEKHPKLIISKNRPEWGTFGVRLEAGGEWYEITGRGDSMVLRFGELKFWTVIE
jgi:hypothetical protein